MYSKVRPFAAAAVMFGAAVVSGCGQVGARPGSPNPPAFPRLERPAVAGDAWRVGTPGSVGLDSLPLRAMAARIESGAYSGIHSVLVARYGRLVFERYFDGPDERLDDQPTTWVFGRDTLHDVRSVSKSVTGLLMGIAIQRGLLPGVHATVGSYFAGQMPPGDPMREAMTVQHLLTMKSGLTDEDEDADSAADTAAAPVDPFATILRRPLAAPPGAEYQYAGANTTILRGILEQVSGQPLDEFADAHFFGPLGIKDYEWMRWLDGSPRAAGGLRLRPRDMAKIGHLMVSEGRWNGRQIVPRQWVRESARPRAQNDEREAYGYHWWAQSYNVGGRNYAAVVANGSGGQRIVAFNSLDLVVVFTGGNYEDMASARLPELMVSLHVLPAVREVVAARRPSEPANRGGTRGARALGEPEPQP